MKVTSIQAQVKTPNRYSVFVDGSYSFSLSGDALLASRLVSGQELSAHDMNRFKKLSSDDKALGLSLAYVSRRMRSKGELTDYFRRKQYAPELTEQIVAKLENLGLVDDKVFAQRWVENRRMLSRSSTKKLQLELRQKKIADDIIRTVLTDDETDEFQILRDLVVKKRRQTKYRDNQKLMVYLAGQGFRYDDIKAVFAEDDIDSM